MPSSDFGYSHQPLEYAGPGPKRLGILTAVGVISIVVGSLSVLMSLSGIFSGIMYLVMSNMKFPVPVAAPVAVPATNPSSGSAAAGSPTWTYTVTTSTTGPSTMPASAVGARVVTGPPMVMPFSFHIAPGASELTIAEAAGSLCVAVLLIIAGSLMLRDSPSAWRLHRIYVVLKIPLIAVAAFAAWWTYSGMMNSLNTMMAGSGGGATPISGNFGNMFALGEATFLSVVSLIYPVALLIVLSTRTAKDHYKIIRGEVKR